MASRFMLRAAKASIVAMLSGGLTFPVVAQTLAPDTSPIPKPNPRFVEQLALAPDTSQAPVASVADAVPRSPSSRALSGLARLEKQGVEVKDQWRGVSVEIAMTRSVPWRVFTLENPERVVVDFSELDWDGIDIPGLLSATDRFSDIRAGLFRPGWTRLVLTLTSPMIVQNAWMSAADDGSTGSMMRLELSQASTAEFAASVGAPDTAAFARPSTRPMPSPKTRQNGISDVVVVLDPGHGGIDPGAEREGVVEADLMLTFARELKEVLLRAGGFEVVMTRDRDVFVPLEERVTIARRAGADVFLSLHADALAQGRATGATVYTLSDEATDAASKSLAERHDREDLLAGVDLTRHSDEVALVLMDLARTETTPRSETLADALVEGIYSATQSTYKTPRLQAGFSVLKAPDIPSALIELGFLSSPRDRKLLQDKTWRLRAAEGIRDALQYWSLQDAANADRLRK